MKRTMIHRLLMLKAVVREKIVEHTVSGAIVTFITNLVAPLKQLVTQINPVQDLHGQSNPYPGGAGKNLLNATFNSSTDTDITFTVEKQDGYVTSVKANGTAAATRRTGGAVTLKAGSYTLTGCPSGGGNSTYSLSVRNNGTSGGVITGADFGSGRNITIESDGTYYVSIVISSGVTATNLVFKPMLRLSTETDATYAPYSNECPITGWTGCELDRTGKNLLGTGTLFASDTLYGTDGNPSQNQNFDTYKIKSTENQKFTFTGIPVDGNMDIRVLQFNNAMAFDSVISSSNGTANTKQTVAITADEGWILVSVRKTVADKMLELGTTASDYESHTGETYSITFPSEAGTVYGGSLTVNEDGSGVLTVVKKEKDLGSLSWTYGSTYDYFRASLTQGKGTEANNIICSAFEYAGICGTNSSMATAKNGTIWKRFDSGLSSNATHLYIKWTDYTDATQFTTAVTGQKVVYELSEPVTYNLTAQQVGQIMTLKGLNNIWASTGDVSVTYYAKE